MTNKVSICKNIQFTLNSKILSIGITISNIYFDKCIQFCMFFINTK